MNLAPVVGMEVSDAAENSVEFLSCDAVVSLGLVQSFAEVRYDSLLPVLFLRQHCTYGKIASITVQHKTTTLGIGVAQNRRCAKCSAQFIEGRLRLRRPLKDAVLAEELVQGPGGRSDE